MSETRVNDRRGEEKPERQQFPIYPTCRTCRYFDHFVNARGQATETTLCVYDPPKTHAQIRGVDDNGMVEFAYSHGWPVVFPGQRCGKHAARDAN